MVLKSITDGYAHWCPGCRGYHILPTKRANARWVFDGNMEKPTFNPSFKHTWTHGPEKVKKCCHYFLHAGVLRFINDCTHDHSGLTVPLPAMPNPCFGDSIE
jgi:hypothetical protein